MSHRDFVKGSRSLALHRLLFLIFLHKQVADSSSSSALETATASDYEY